tara:strand:- start:156 stop:347 length:192 start_codon:yes stop_codon:yes gene_type:complete
MSIKNFTWKMKSRGKIDTVKGVDEHGDFKSRQWEDKNGNPCYNFWDPKAGHPRTAVNYTVTKA